jgi:hypothetical protein
MSLTNGNRQSKPAAKRQSLFTREPADWASISSDAIRDAIVQVGAMGGALRFGYSRDGGAYSIGVYGLQPQPFTEYLRPGDDVSGYLDTLADEARRALTTPVGPTVTEILGQGKP